MNKQFIGVNKEKIQNINITISLGITDIIVPTIWSLSHLNCLGCSHLSHLVSESLLPIRRACLVWWSNAMVHLPTTNQDGIIYFDLWY